jgi:hypothetical protein
MQLADNFNLLLTASNSPDISPGQLSELFSSFRDRFCHQLIHRDFPAVDKLRPLSAPSWNSCLGLCTVRVLKRISFVLGVEKRPRTLTTFPSSRYWFSAVVIIVKRTRDSSLQRPCSLISLNRSLLPQTHLCVSPAFMKRLGFNISGCQTPLGYGSKLIATVPWPITHNTK